MLFVVLCLVQAAMLSHYTYLCLGKTQTLGDITFHSLVYYWSISE